MPPLFQDQESIKGALPLVNYPRETSGLGGERKGGLVRRCRGPGNRGEKNFPEGRLLAETKTSFLTVGKAMKSLVWTTNQLHLERERKPRKQIPRELS